MEVYRLEYVPLLLTVVWNSLFPRTFNDRVRSDYVSKGETRAVPFAQRLNDLRSRARASTSVADDVLEILELRRRT